MARTSPSSTTALPLGTTVSFFLLIMTMSVPRGRESSLTVLPASLFDLDGKGYWMMYQDAETGKNVRLSQK